MFAGCACGTEGAYGSAWAENKFKSTSYGQLCASQNEAGLPTGKKDIQAK
jgi:hypothetical protein